MIEENMNVYAILSKIIAGLMLLSVVVTAGCSQTCSTTRLTVKSNGRWIDTYEAGSADLASRALQASSALDVATLNAIQRRRQAQVAEIRDFLQATRARDSEWAQADRELIAQRETRQLQWQLSVPVASYRLFSADSTVEALDDKLYGRPQAGAQLANESVKLVDVRDNTIIGAVDYVMPLGPRTRALLGTQ